MEKPEKTSLCIPDTLREARVFTMRDSVRPKAAGRAENRREKRPYTRPRNGRACLSKQEGQKVTLPIPPFSGHGRLISGMRQASTPDLDAPAGFLSASGI